MIVFPAVCDLTDIFIFIISNSDIERKRLNVEHKVNDSTQISGWGWGSERPVAVLPNQW